MTRTLADPLAAVLLALGVVGGSLAAPAAGTAPPAAATPAAAAAPAAGTAPAAAATPAAGTAPAQTVGVRAATTAAALPRWDGSLDLYRSGAFTTQKTWRWCTAASVQIIRNIARRQADHTYASQQRYYRYMRANNRYPVRAADGVDPGGWAAGLRRYVDDRYRVVRGDSFGAALASAVTAMRRTNLPVGLLVARGNHAWILVGFSATADPARTRDFTVTSVRVVGPLWGLQSRSYGYDMRPNRNLTRVQFRDFFRPWHYAPIRMAWEGDWVSIQPVGR